MSSQIKTCQWQTQRFLYSLSGDSRFENRGLQKKKVEDFYHPLNLGLWMIRAVCVIAQYNFTCKMLKLNRHLFEVSEIECFIFILFYLIYFLGADLVIQGKTIKAASILRQKNCEQPCLVKLILSTKLTGQVFVPLTASIVAEQEGSSLKCVNIILQKTGPSLTSTLGEIIFWS